MHDTDEDAEDNVYFPTEMFRGFGKERVKFIYAALKKARECDTILLSHINLLPVGWLIKKTNPAKKVIMFAHGIEVWEHMDIYKKKMLGCCDEFFCVSNYTRERMVELHNIPGGKCKVLNNSLDPFLTLPSIPGKDEDLLAKYGFNKTDKILFSLTRLSLKDRYKGYDKVLSSMAILIKEEPSMRYVIAGSYDKEEKRRIDNLILDMGLQKQVVITGYVPEEALASFFKMADVYVMPSLKEGFGIVFIEAMYYGIPVIAGNKDGSVDALCNGELGLLVDPASVPDITAAIRKVLQNTKAYIPDRDKMIRLFGYDIYKERLSALLGLETVKVTPATEAAMLSLSKDGAK